MTVEAAPNEESDGLEVLIRPLAGREAVLVGQTDGSADWTVLAASAAKTVRAALGLADGTPVGERRFTLSRKSLLALSQHRTQNVEGGYFRGILIRGDGKYAHQLQLKEVLDKPTGVDFLSATNALQIAAMQAQLNQMQEVLEYGIDQIEAIKGHLEVQQAADANSAISTIRRIFDDCESRGGSVGQVDWTRLAHLEHLVAAGLDAVEQELENTAAILTFTGNAKDDERIIKRISPDRIRTLVQMHLGLEAALRRWTYLMAIRKLECAEHDDKSGSKYLDDLDILTQRRQHLVDTIMTAVDGAPKVHGREWWELLATDGLIRGWDIDEKRVTNVENYMAAVKATKVLQQARQPLPGSGARLMVDAK